MAFDHFNGTAQFDQAVGQINTLGDGCLSAVKQPPPRATVRIDIKEISNGWVLQGLTSDRAMDFEGDRYYTDIGTLLADLERRLIDAGYKESGHDE